MQEKRSNGRRLVYGRTIKTLIERNLKLNNEIAIANNWGAKAYKNWTRIAKNRKKWLEFIAYLYRYCPIIRDGHFRLSLGMVIRDCN